MLILRDVVQIELGGLLCLFLGHVDDPEGCLLARASVRVLVDIFLRYCLDSDIVELAPDVLVVVLDEGVVVTRLRVAIVDTNSVQVVRTLLILKRFKCFINLILQI